MLLYLALTHRIADYSHIFTIGFRRDNLLNFKINEHRNEKVRPHALCLWISLKATKEEELPKT
jgi:hypothetical protein